MIEILNRKDTEKVTNLKLLKYLQYSLKRLPSDFKLPEYGYFIVIEKYEELLKRPIKLKCCSLPSIDSGLIDMIELVELKDSVIEILILIDTDFAVSFIVELDILPFDIQNKLFSFLH